MDFAQLRGAGCMTPAAPAGLAPIAIASERTTGQIRSPVPRNGL